MGAAWGVDPNSTGLHCLSVPSALPVCAVGGLGLADTLMQAGERSLNPLPLCLHGQEKLGPPKARPCPREQGAPRLGTDYAQCPETRRAPQSQWEGDGLTIQVEERGGGLRGHSCAGEAPTGWRVLGGQGCPRKTSLRR